MVRWTRIATTVGLAACLPEPPEVLSYELSYGECLGVCRYEVEVALPDLVVTAGRDDVSVADVRTVQLTHEGQEAWDDAVGDLFNVPPVTGCPGCLDGGVVEVMLLQPDGEETSHRWERGAPPEPAVALDALMEEVLDASMRCVASSLLEDLVDCTPVE